MPSNLWSGGPSVLWRCWLGGRKGVWPVKNWVVGCWHGYLSGVKCKWFIYRMVQLTPLPPIISCSIKIQNGLPFWCRLTQIVLEKRLLHRRSSSSKTCGLEVSTGNSRPAAFQQLWPHATYKTKDLLRCQRERNYDLTIHSVSAITETKV